VDLPLGWFRIRKVPVLDLQVQADTYLACGLLSETLNTWWLPLCVTTSLSASRACSSIASLSGYYPRLTLAPGQRFASKGGYLVHFAEPTGAKLMADANWIVP